MKTFGSCMSVCPSLRDVAASPPCPSHIMTSSPCTRLPPHISSCCSIIHQHPQRCIQIPILVLRQCRRLALYLPVRNISTLFSLNAFPQLSTTCSSFLVFLFRSLASSSSHQPFQEHCLPNRIPRPQTDPLRNWAVLLGRFGEFLFCAEGFLRLRFSLRQQAALTLLMQRRKMGLRCLQASLRLRRCLG